MEDCQSKSSGSKSKSNNECMTKYPTIVYLYNNELRKLLQDLTVLSNICNKEDGEDGFSGVIQKARNLQVSSTLTCTSCNCNFADHREQRAHYKTDWHRYNLKQKIKGQPPIDIETFMQMTGSDHKGETENTMQSGLKLLKLLPPSAIPSYINKGECTDSDSSTDTDSDAESSSMDEDEENKYFKNAKIFFRNGEKKILCMYRCVLFPKQVPPAHDGELIRLLCNVPDKLSWSIILLGGGRFAAAVFSGQTVLQHKTFRRYTIRAKQGTMQSTNDKQNGPQQRSAGAGLRRHNEMALVQDIQNLLELWAAELNRSDCIFYHAPGPNRSILFGGKSPTLKKNDSRIRPIPFQTGRATFQEVLRVHELLCSVEFYDNLEAATTISESPRHKKILKISNKGKKGKREHIHDSLRKSLSKQGEPCFENFSCSSDSESFSLVEDDEILSTSHLKMFEATRKPRHRRKKMESQSIDS